MQTKFAKLVGELTLKLPEYAEALVGLKRLGIPPAHTYRPPWGCAMLAAECKRARKKSGRRRIRSNQGSTKALRKTCRKAVKLCRKLAKTHRAIGRAHCYAIVASGAFVVGHIKHRTNFNKHVGKPKFRKLLGAARAGGLALTAASHYITWQLAGGRSQSRPRHWVASHHSFGVAVDIDDPHKRKAQFRIPWQAVRILEMDGLFHWIPGDASHFEYQGPPCDNGGRTPGWPRFTEMRRLLQGRTQRALRKGKTVKLRYLIRRINKRANKLLLGGAPALPEIWEADAHKVDACLRNFKDSSAIVSELRSLGQCLSLAKVTRTRRKKKRKKRKKKGKKRKKSEKRSKSKKRGGAKLRR